jgi:cytochrome P450
MAQVLVNNYKEATAILTNRDFAQSLYDESSIIMQDVILTSEGDSHINRRKTEFHLFRKEISRNYEQVDFPKILKPIIDDAVSNGSSNLVELGYLVTMNVTADISGIDMPENNFLKTRNLLRLVKIFSEGATLVHSLKNKKKIRQQVLDALEVFDKEFYSSSLNRRKGLLKKFERGEINEDHLPKDILTLLLRNQKKLHLSNEIIRREVAFYLQAGSHSTANASTHAFHELFEWIKSHPEDKNIIQKDKFFLQKCVFETLRLHPASPVAWRKATKIAKLLGKNKVKEGDRIIIDLWNSNRDISVYGLDATKYNPYRGTPKNYPPWGLTFGIGSHACLARVLDGGEIPKSDTDIDRHNFGLITCFMKYLLDRGAEPSNEDSPQEDNKTERQNWGRYPIIFRKR